MTSRAGPLSFGSAGGGNLTPPVLRACATGDGAVEDDKASTAAARRAEIVEILAGAVFTLLLSGRIFAQAPATPPYRSSGAFHSRKR